LDAAKKTLFFELLQMLMQVGISHGYVLSSCELTISGISLGWKNSAKISDKPSQVKGSKPAAEDRARRRITGS